MNWPITFVLARQADVPVAYHAAMRGARKEFDSSLLSLIYSLLLPLSGKNRGDQILTRDLLLPRQLGSTSELSSDLERNDCKSNWKTRIQRFSFGRKIVDHELFSLLKTAEYGRLPSISRYGCWIERYDVKRHPSSRVGLAIAAP